eukprot:jgi/Mesvir1/11311/Mv25056-RA.3
MAHVRVDKPVPKPAMQSTGDSASRGPPRSTSPSMSRRSSEWLLARGPWLLLSFSALYILLTTAVCIFVESSTAFQDVRFLSNWHMNIMVMFLGALALNLVGLITDHDHPSKWQVSVTTMFINSAAAICHLTAVLGKAPVITSSFGGRPLLPMRYIQWSFTTAAMTYLHSHIWHWDALLTIQMMMLATFMSVTGLLGTWMAFPLNVMGMAVSFYCFALLGQGLWHGYRIHLSSKDCEFSMVALRRIVLATSFLWSTYPTIWVVGGVGLISPELEEVLMGIMDVVSKGVVTHTMVQLHAVAHERHRAKSLLELEYWGSQATLERMEAILIARDRVVMSVCHELQAPVHGIIGLCESLIKMQSQGDRTSPSGRGSPRAGERGVERTPRAYGREIGEYYGTVAMLEGRDSYFRQVIRTMKSTSERLTVVLRSALDRSTSPTSPIPLKCQRIFVGDCVRHMLSLMHPLLPPNVNVTLSWDASRGNTAAEDDMYVVPVMADPSRVSQVGAYAEALASLDKKDETRTAERGGPQSSPKGLGMSQGAAVVARLLEDTKLKLGLDSKSDAKDIEAVLDGYRDKMLVLYDQLNAAVRRVEDLIAQKAWLEKQLEKYRGSSGTSPSEQTPSAQAAAAEGLSPCPAGAGGLNSPEAMGSAAQNHRSRVDLIVAEASDLVSELVARVSTQLPSLLSAQFSQLLHRWHQQHLRTAHHADAVNRLHQLNIPQHLMLSGEPFSRQGGGGQAYPPQPGGGGIHPGGPELMGSRWAFPPSPGLAGSIIGAGIERRYSVGSIRYAMQTSPTSQTSPLAGSPIKRNHSLPGGRQSGRAWGVLGSGGAHLSNSMPASPSGVFGRPVFPTPPMQQQQQIPMHPQQGGGGPGPQGPPQVGTPGIHPFPKLALPNKALIQQPIAENGSLKRGDGSGAGAGSHATTPAKLRPMDVRTFLGLVGMESLCDVMEREAITVEMFSYIDDADMADLGITSAATRTLIRLAARRVVAGHAMAGSPGKELANGSPGNELANGSAGNEPANGSASGNGSLSPMSPT